MPWRALVRPLRRGLWTGADADGMEALEEGGILVEVERPDCAFDSCGERSELMSILTQGRRSNQETRGRSRKILE